MTQASPVEAFGIYEVYFVGTQEQRDVYAVFHKGKEWQPYLGYQEMRRLVRELKQEEYSANHNTQRKEVHL